MVRLLALLLGCSLAAAVLAVGLRIRKQSICAGPTVLHIVDPRGQLHDIELHVVDARGHPIEPFDWTLSGVGLGSSPSLTVDQAADPDEGEALSVPPRGILIQIHANGFSRTRVGPLEFEALPARLEVVLADVGEVVGKVTYGGQPVAGARVMLLDPSGVVTKGIPSGLSCGFKGLSTTTDATGAFRIGSEFPDRQYYVGASKEGHATGAAGPARVGDPPVEVQLHDGGAIEGHLRLAETHDPDGAEIELYRTDTPDWQVDAYGHFVARADAEGRFRFERVDSGPWLVRLKPPDRKAYEQPPQDHLPFLVDVEAEETVQLEMDLSRPPARLEGRMMINGKPWSATRVFLHAIGEKALVLDTARADKEGWWTVRARVPGPYRVLARGGCEDDMQPEPFSDVVELTPEGVRWEHEFAWGACPHLER